MCWHGRPGAAWLAPLDGPTQFRVHSKQNSFEMRLVDCSFALPMALDWNSSVLGAAFRLGCATSLACSIYSSGVYNLPKARQGLFCGVEVGPL
jgi:hypothetical protein